MNTTQLKHLLSRDVLFEAYCSSYEVFTPEYKHKRVNLDRLSWPENIINPKGPRRFYSNIVWFLLYEAEQGRYK